jgi:predicted cupin superfamily sugar epimerase
MNDLAAEEIRQLLGLEPNATCGYVRVSYRSPVQVPSGALPDPFSEARPMGSALYFMVTPEQRVRLHRIRNDQLYHYYAGDPLEVLLLRGRGERAIVGPDLRAGHVVQLLIPGGTFHTARLIGAGRWFLGGSTAWPGVIPTDVEMGDADALARAYPDLAGDLVRRASAASATR